MPRTTEELLKDAERVAEVYETHIFKGDNTRLTTLIAELSAKLREREDRLDKITRVEVIDHTGRAYVNLNAKTVGLQFQDEGRTLKVFTEMALYTLAKKEQDHD